MSDAKKSGSQVLKERQTQIASTTAQILGDVVMFLRKGEEPSIAAESAALAALLRVRYIPAHEDIVRRAVENVRVIGECVEARMRLGLDEGFAETTQRIKALHSKEQEAA